MAIERERLDKVWIDDQGRRWGQFRVYDVELLSLQKPYEGKVEIWRCAARLGLHLGTLQEWRGSSDGCSLIIYGRMKHDVKPPDEVVADYVSNRRHIDLSILE